MKKAIFIILCPLLVAVFYGCEEFIEKDLTGKKVTILAPADSLGISITTITFWWKEIEGALDYNVQVVSPAFNKAEKLWADTFVVGNKFDLSLVPGDYQWRVKGRNGSSETNFTVASFVIDSGLDLSKETIILRSPSDNATSNNLSQVFKWNKLYNAGEYRFRILNSDNTTLKDEVIRGSESSSFEFTEDGSYIWSVRGQNDISNTLYSSYTIIIDTESPGKPSLKSPLNESVLTTDSISFEWTRMEDAGSLFFDSLCVFRDNSLTDKVLSKKTDKTSYKDTLDAGAYWWYVRTSDAAGNLSERSPVFRFIKN